MNQVGKNIRRLRQGAGLSQEQLAERLHVTRQAVSGWETGRAQPDLETLEQIAAVFQTGMLTVIYGPQPKEGLCARERRIAAWEAAGFGAGALALSGLNLALRPAVERAYYRYQMALPLLSLLLLRPALFFCLGWFCAALLALCSVIRSLGPAPRRVLRWGGLGLLALHYLLLLLPSLPVAWPHALSLWAITYAVRGGLLLPLLGGLGLGLSRRRDFQPAPEAPPQMD